MSVRLYAFILFRFVGRHVWFHYCQPSAYRVWKEKAAREQQRQELPVPSRLSLCICMLSLAVTTESPELQLQMSVAANCALVEQALQTHRLGLSLQTARL